MHEAQVPDRGFDHDTRRRIGHVRGRIRRAVGTVVVASTLAAGTARAATSDVLVVLGGDGRSHVVQHTLSSDGAIVRLELAEAPGPEAIRFSGPERATFTEAWRRSPRRVALWSGSALVRYRGRYDDALERDAADTFRLQVPSVPDRLSVEDGELTVSSLTWALPDELEIVSFGGGEERGRWSMDDGLLTFEQHGDRSSTLDVAWRRRDTDSSRSSSPPPADDPSVPPLSPDPSDAAAGPDRDGEAVDADADGVPDRRDVCLGSEHPERVDRFGCREPTDDERATLVLDGIAFPVGRSYLDADARAVLDRLARALLAGEGGGAESRDTETYEVAAHTDGAGSRARNLGLSARRAEAVRHYLMLRGVGPNRLRARGYGEARPLADDRTAAGRRANRRIELARIDER